MIVIHKRKKSFQNNAYEQQKNYQKFENNYNTININNNRKHYSLNKKPSSSTEKRMDKTYRIDKNQRNIPIRKIRTQSPQEDNLNQKYSRNTFNHFQISSINHNNSEENILRRKNEVIFPKIKNAFNKDYNLSEVYSNAKKTEKPLVLYNNLKSIQNNKRNNTMAVNINIENNNKFLINEELSNQIYKNHQTKTTKISKIKTLQKEKSQEELKKRLQINPANPLAMNKRNNTTIFVTERNKNNNSNIKNKNVAANDDKNSENKRDNINNRKYYDSNHSRQSNSHNKKNNIINNIITNRRIPYSNNKDKDRDKDRDRDKDKDKKNEENKREIKRPKPVINHYESYSDDDESDEDSESLDNLANSLSSLNLNPGDDFGQPKSPIFLSPLIFSSFHDNFTPSTYSSDNEFNKNDIIKAYAYNTSEGNIRDYNEDTITATKLFFNPKDKTNYAYYFAIYDGHGGDGCSLYLKKHLYKKIKEPTAKGLRNAINETEKNFLEKVALTPLGNLDDTSGSCGVMVLIKNKKCIIANLGDSRCVLYRSKRMVFSTRDHKPNSDFERKRIESAGGSIYKSKTHLSLYQNGKKVEVPWRVNPGGLSVSRTFGDIESKEIKFGGKKGVVVALPDIAEFELCDEHNFLVMGCDGIFDVLSNKEIMECIKIVLRINKNKKKKINELCGDFANMIIKSALAKESFDNVSCIVVVFNVNDII